MWISEKTLCFTCFGPACSSNFKHCLMVSFIVVDDRVIQDLVGVVLLLHVFAECCCDLVACLCGQGDDVHSSLC